MKAFLVVIVIIFFLSTKFLYFYDLYIKYIRKREKPWKKEKVPSIKELVNEYTKNKSKLAIENLLVYYPVHRKTRDILISLLNDSNWDLRFLACDHLENLDQLYALIKDTPADKFKYVLSAISRIEKDTYIERFINIYTATESMELKKSILQIIKKLKNEKYINLLITVLKNSLNHNEDLVISSMEALKTCGNKETLGVLVNYTQDDALSAELKHSLNDTISALKARLNISTDGWLTISKNDINEGGLSFVEQEEGKLSFPAD